jgi:purine-binding chemotaxis protein CheW
MNDLRTDEDQQQYLTFTIAGEEYAIGILRVREIMEYSTSTRVPSTAPCVIGVINLRGRVVPLIDLAMKFGQGQTSITKWTCIVIAEVDVEGESTVVGILADAVSHVVDLASSEIEPPPAFGLSGRRDYLVGMGRSGARFILILDVDRLLSAESMAANVSQREDEALAVADRV